MLAFIHAISFLLCIILSVALYIWLPSWKAKHLMISMILSCVPILNTLILVALGIMMTKNVAVDPHDKH